MTAGFYARYAWRALRRDGQRSVLSIVCVAFGVLSLVALQQLAHVINDALLVPPRVARGADAVLTRPGSAIAAADLDSLAAFGIDHYSPEARTRAHLLKTRTSGRAVIVAGAMGVDTNNFPLYGEVELREPMGLTVGDAIRRPGGAIVTRDLADRNDLSVGDGFFIFGAPNAPPFELTVAAVAEQTPDRMGQNVYFSIETARERGLGRVTHVAVRHPEIDAVAPRLRASGWTVSPVREDPDSEAADLFRFMLAGTGILGLLIGGIGVANTMQVLLARRTREIAVLKTIGYGQEHLLVLFGIEAAMLGLIGSVLGAVAGLSLSSLLTELIGRSMPFLLTFAVRLEVVASGVLVGVATTLIFGLVAIVRASNVRPSALLRETRLEVSGRRRAVSVALYAALWILFGILSSMVLGSALKGFGVVAAGVVALALLGLVLGLILAVVVRTPVPAVSMLGMARRNLRHEPVRSIYGLVALFVGVVSIGFATVSLYNANERRITRTLDLAGVNARVYGSADDEDALRQALADVGVTRYHTEYSAVSRMYTASDSLIPGLSEVVGRRQEYIRWNITLTDSVVVPLESSAYLLDRVALRHSLIPGDTIRLRNEYGEAMVRLAGVFSTDVAPFDIAHPPRGLVVPRPIALQLGPSGIPIEVSLAANPERLADVTAAIGAAVPQSVVIGKDAIGDAIHGYFTALFWFVIAVAGLALVAGAVLIANAVGLSMLERRRELGVLKAIGYNSAQVLWTVVLENALLGIIGGAAGLAAVGGTVAVVNARFPSAELTLGVGQSLLLMAVAVALAVFSAMFVAWRPTHVRPLTVLRGA